MIAEKHPQQAERLATLYSYDILDTPREADFDEIVELASQICDAPISVINIIDAERQWFKAEVGLNARETPLATSLCSHVILEDDFVEIPDTLQDRRMSDNPLCSAEPGVRFYAGARLLAPNGLPIGTLCVLDNEPRQINDLQRLALKVLSRQVMKQLELRRALMVQKTLRDEADHRVKNSLQTLSSVVRLYRRRLSTNSPLDAFDAILRRIEAVGALHGELQGSDARHVSSSSFLDRVVGLLQESALENVSISCDAEDISLSANAASALGMIISEFVANSLKHGFPNGEDGSIHVSFKQENGHVLLECHDNGMGASAARSNGSGSHHLGSKLMEAAVSQLGGDMSQTLTSDGCTLCVRI